MSWASGKKNQETINRCPKNEENSISGRRITLKTIRLNVMRFFPGFRRWKCDSSGVFRWLDWKLRRELEIATPRSRGFNFMRLRKKKLYNRENHQEELERYLRVLVRDSPGFDFFFRELFFGLLLLSV